MKIKISLMLIIYIFSFINIACNKSPTSPENSTKNVIYGVKPNSTVFKMDLSNLQVMTIGSLGFIPDDGYDGLDFNIDGKLYFGEAATGNLYLVDTATGAATFVRNIPLSYTHITECVAFAPVEVPGPDSVFPAGTLFASQSGNLHAINIKTGEVQYIGETGHDDDAFDFSKEGILYGIDGARSLYTINTQTAESEEICTNPPGWGNLTFAPDGFLYSEYYGILYRFDPETGEADSIYHIADEIIGLASIL